MEWYFAESTSHIGPVDEAYLGEAFASQHIDGQTLVWRDGMEKWAPISEVPELKAALRGDDESEDAEETPPKTPDQEKKIVPKTAEEKKLHNAERRRMYRERQKTKRALGFATNVKRNVHVYVSGLPRDEAVCSVEALAEIFKQAGILQTDSTTQRPRVKLYTNEDGKLKGDALVSYLNTESVDLAVRFLHGTQFEGQTISVIPAKFDHIPTTSLQLAELQTRARELQVYDRGKRRKIQERRQEDWGVAVSSGKPLLVACHCWTADTAQAFGVVSGLYVWIAARLMVALKHLFGESVIKKVTPINGHPQGVCVLRADTNDSAEWIMKVMLDAPEARLWAGGEAPLRFDVYQKGVDLSSQVPVEEAWITPEESESFVRSLGDAELPVAQRLIRKTTHAIRLNGPPTRDSATAVQSPDAEQAARLDKFGQWLDEQSSSDDEFAVRTEQ
ncbi:MAG: hypothetical protein KVP17_002123 [Porospora cf. gigantea B]|nr:MAG: hypothetical protein KVP17_002123 [Porospora cf. gigantea B]